MDLIFVFFFFCSGFYGGKMGISPQGNGFQGGALKSRHMSCLMFSILYFRG